MEESLDHSRDIKLVLDEVARAHTEITRDNLDVLALVFASRFVPSLGLRQECAHVIEYAWVVEDLEVLGALQW